MTARPGYPGAIVVARPPMQQPAVLPPVPAVPRQLSMEDIAKQIGSMKSSEVAQVLELIMTVIMEIEITYLSAPGVPEVRNALIPLFRFSARALTTALTTYLKKQWDYFAASKVTDAGKILEALFAQQEQWMSGNFTVTDATPRIGVFASLFCKSLVHTRAKSNIFSSSATKDQAARVLGACDRNIRTQWTAFMKILMGLSSMVWHQSLVIEYQRGINTLLPFVRPLVCSMLFVAGEYDANNFPSCFTAAAQAPAVARKGGKRGLAELVLAPIPMGRRMGGDDVLPGCFVTPGQIIGVHRPSNPSVWSMAIVLDPSQDAKLPEGAILVDVKSSKGPMQMSAKRRILVFNGPHVPLHLIPPLGKPIQSMAERVGTVCRHSGYAPRAGGMTDPAPQAGGQSGAADVPYFFSGFLAEGIQELKKAGATNPHEIPSGGSADSDGRSGGLSSYYTVCFTRPIVCWKLKSLGQDAARVLDFGSSYKEPPGAVGDLGRDEHVYPQPRDWSTAGYPAIAEFVKRFRGIAAKDPKDTWEVLNAWSQTNEKYSGGVLSPDLYWTMGLPTRRHTDPKNLGLPPMGILPDKATFVAMYGGKPDPPAKEMENAVCYKHWFTDDCSGSGLKCRFIKGLSDKAGTCGRGGGEELRAGGLGEECRQKLCVVNVVDKKSWRAYALKNHYDKKKDHTDATRAEFASVTGCWDEVLREAPDSTVDCTKKDEKKFGQLEVEYQQRRMGFDVSVDETPETLKRKLRDGFNIPDDWQLSLYQYYASGSKRISWLDTSTYNFQFHLGRWVNTPRSDLKPLQLQASACIDMTGAIVTYDYEPLAFGAICFRDFDSIMEWVRERFAIPSEQKAFLSFDGTPIYTEEALRAESARARVRGEPFSLDLVLAMDGTKASKPKPKKETKPKKESKPKKETKSKSKRETKQARTKTKARAGPVSGLKAKLSTFRRRHDGTLRLGDWILHRSHRPEFELDLVEVYHGREKVGEYEVNERPKQTKRVPVSAIRYTTKTNISFRTEQAAIEWFLGVQ